jgi:Arc/MetJ-type ribon-helix-helix transcriptional regulator
MQKEKTVRDVTCVNVEVPGELIEWMDAEAAEHETSRSGLVRIALRLLMKLRLAKGGRNEEGAK